VLSYSSRVPKMSSFPYKVNDGEVIRQHAVSAGTQGRHVCDEDGREWRSGGGGDVSDVRVIKMFQIWRYRITCRMQGLSLTDVSPNLCKYSIVEMYPIIYE